MKTELLEGYALARKYMAQIVQGDSTAALNTAVTGRTNAPVNKSESSSTSRRSIWRGTSSQEARLVAGCGLVICRHTVLPEVLLYRQQVATFFPRTLGPTLHSLTLTELAISSVLIKQTKGAALLLLSVTVRSSAALRALLPQAIGTQAVQRSPLWLVQNKLRAAESSAPAVCLQIVADSC